MVLEEKRMRINGRLAAGLFAVTVTASLFTIDAHAAANVTTVLPNGGVNLALAKAAPL